MVMIVGLLLLTVSLAMTAFGAVSLRTGIANGTVAAHDDPLWLVRRPVSLWVWRACAILVVLAGLALLAAAIALLFRTT